MGSTARRATLDASAIHPFELLEPSVPGNFRFSGPQFTQP